MSTARGRGPAKKAVPSKPVEPVVEVAEETAEQRELRELREELARLKEAAFAKPDPEAASKLDDEKPKDGDDILIHFVEDGFTAQGEIWYRGQELQFTVGNKAWQDTLDRQGNSWVLADDRAQMNRFDKVMFRRGPWPGKASYQDGEWEKDAPELSALEQADIRERERRRAGAPTLPTDLR